VPRYGKRRQQRAVGLDLRAGLVDAVVKAEGGGASGAALGLQAAPNL
jgi:hypothetical protein